MSSSWNSPWQPEKYNFVQYAINEGYSVFFYDRIGIGNSTRCVFVLSESRPGN